MEKRKKLPDALMSLEEWLRLEEERERAEEKIPVTGHTCREGGFKGLRVRRRPALGD